MAAQFANFVIATPAPATATPIPPTPTPTLTPEPTVTISGHSEENSRPFALRGGNYSIQWSAKSTSEFDDNTFYAQLVSVSTPHRDLVSFSGGAAAGKIASGQTNVYGVSKGEYYISGSLSGTNVSMD